jgi:hypothetical protein
VQTLVLLWPLHRPRLLLWPLHLPQVLSLLLPALPLRPLLRLPKNPDFSLNSSG